MKRAKKAPPCGERDGALNGTTSKPYGAPPKAQCSILKVRHGKDPRFKGRPYTRILNETLLDERLGGMARAILCYALSRPENWKLHSWEVAKRFHCGEWATRSGMKDLAEAGYARLVLARTATGTIRGRAWQIREAPELPWPSDPLVSERRTPRRGLPSLGKPMAGKPPRLNKE